MWRLVESKIIVNPMALLTIFSVILSASLVESDEHSRSKCHSRNARQGHLATGSGGAVASDDQADRQLEIQGLLPDIEHLSGITKVRRTLKTLIILSSAIPSAEIFPYDALEPRSSARLSRSNRDHFLCDSARLERSGVLRI